MFRLLNKQAVKVVRKPIPLCSRTTPRGAHNMQAPYSGPPSYETIAKRFSSPIDPLTYFYRKHQQEAISRGQFVDIHDIGLPNPRDYDVLIPDVDHNELQHDIAEVVGIPYHSPSSKEDANKVINIGEGLIYSKAFIDGGKPRTMFPAVVSHNASGKAHWVFLLVDTASPLTYLSAQVNNPTGEKNTLLTTLDERPIRHCGRSWRVVGQNWWA